MNCLLILSLITVGAVSSPANLAKNVSPAFDAEADVMFFLYTRANPDTPQELKLRDMSTVVGSHYSVNRPTRVLIHGFQTDGNTEVVIEIKDSYLRSYDVNVIVLDWGAGANTINYITARNRVNQVGVVLAIFCDFLHEHNVLDFSRLYFIGGSLGAHLAGMAGKSLRRGRVNTIHGMVGWT